MAIITFGGDLGSGKTTIAERLAKDLGFGQLYVGQIFRDMALEAGLPLEVFYDRLRNDPELERSVDERQAKLMREKDNQVVQGRVAFHFAKQSPFRVVNVFLGVCPEVGAERMKSRPAYGGKTLEEIAAITARRVGLERERYRALYGIENHLDPKHYDLVLDTSSLTENEAYMGVLLGTLLWSLARSS